MRRFASLFVGGAVLLLGLKLFTMLVLPLVGLFVGLAVFAIKLVVFAAVAYFLYSLVRNRRQEQDA